MKQRYSEREIEKEKDPLTRVIMWASLLEDKDRETAAKGLKRIVRSHKGRKGASEI